METRVSWYDVSCSLFWIWCLVLSLNPCGAKTGARHHKNKKNIEDVISQFKPPIFWKDKEIVKQQVQNWSYESTENLIYKINDVELLIKKNSNNSLNILSDFIIEQATVANN